MPGYDQQRWTFTLNNYEAHHEQLLKDLYPNFVKWLVYQPEIGASGTPHLQGAFVTAKRMPRGSVLSGSGEERTGFMAVFAGIHLEVMRGTPKQNRDYCSKSETKAGEMVELGTMPNSGGEQIKETLESLRKDAKKGMSAKELEDEYSMIELRYPRYFSKQLMTSSLMKARNLSQSGYPEVYWITGKSGSGKTTLAKAMAAQLTESSEYFILDPTADNLWFDGYNSEPVLIVDDVSPRWAKLDQLKSICDRARETRIPVKGGMMYLVAEHVILTSCSSCVDNYADAELARRIRHELLLGVEQPTQRVVHLAPPAIVAPPVLHVPEDIDADSDGIVEL